MCGDDHSSSHHSYDHHDHIASAVIHLIAEMIGCLVREVRDSPDEGGEGQEGAERERRRHMPAQLEEQRPLSESIRHTWAVLFVARMIYSSGLADFVQSSKKPIQGQKDQVNALLRRLHLSTPRHKASLQKRLHPSNPNHSEK
jgi:hypothetical protein